MFAELEQKVLGAVSQTIRKAVISTALSGIGIILLLIALSFFSFAGYMRLTAKYSPVEAALITGGVLTGAALIVFIIGMLFIKSGAKKQVQTKPVSPDPIPHIRTGFPLVDLAQILIPLILPLREHAANRIKNQPISTAVLALATGVITGFFLLTRRRPEKERPKK